MDESMKVIAEALIDKIHKELKKVLEDKDSTEEEKVFAEVILLRSLVDHRSFLIGRKAFENKENAVLIRDYFRLVLAGFETFEKENFGEEK